MLSLLSALLLSLFASLFVTDARAQSASAEPESAEPAPWYLGLPVGQVGTSAPDGALPDASLKDLLQMTEGALYDPALVRADLKLLYGVGAFASVEAVVEPGFAYDDDGVPVEAVWLTYEVTAAPTLKRIRISGNRAFWDAEILQAAGLRGGARFFPAHDVEPLRHRLEAWYLARGFLGTEIQIELQEDDGLDLKIQIEEGTPRILGRLFFVGPSPFSDRQMRTLAKRGGLVVGRRYAPTDVRGVRESLQLMLRERGWSQARVTVLFGSPEPGLEGESLTMIVEPGYRLVIEGRGRELPPASQLEALMDLGGSGGLEEARLRVLQDLRERGYLKADVTLEVVEEGDTRAVLVTADAGPRYRLLQTRFVGAESVDEAVLIEALEQASPDVIGRGRATEDTIEGTFEALEDLYRSRGYLEATFTLLHFDISGLSISAEIRVDEGPRTTLERLEIGGWIPEVAEVLADEVAALEGAALDPLALQALNRRIVELHRDLGHLDADSVYRTRADDGLATVQIAVFAGEPLYLRTVVVRGNRRTLRRVIVREVAIPIGGAITPDALDATREGLYDLKVFSVVEADLQGDTPRVRDLVLEVEELAPLSLELGGGFSTDQGVRTFLQAERRNVWGRAHRLWGVGQVGFGYVGDTWSLDVLAPEWRAALNYEAPALPFERADLQLGVLFNEQDLEPTYTMRGTGGGLGLSVELGPDGEADFVLDYQLQRRLLEDVDPGALVDGDPWLDALGIEEPDDSFELDKVVRRQSGPGALLLVDRRDDPFNPTQGYVLSTRLQAWDLIGSDQWGVKATGRFSVIVPTGPLQIRLQSLGGVGWSEGYNTLPLEERFRLGGAGTLRGFLADSVGPKQRVADQALDWPAALEPAVDYQSRGDPDRWVPTGGDAVALFSTELWVPLELMGVEGAGDTALVTFSDLGNVYFLSPTACASCSGVRLGGLDPELDNEPLFRVGVGLGLRFPTPVGPAQIDYALNPVFFTEDWAAERGEVRGRLHIALGAF